MLSIRRNPDIVLALSFLIFLRTIFIYWGGMIFNAFPWLNRGGIRKSRSGLVLHETGNGNIPIFNKRFIEEMFPAILIRSVVVLSDPFGRALRGGNVITLLILFRLVFVCLWVECWRLTQYLSVVVGSKTFVGEGDLAGGDVIEP